MSNPSNAVEFSTTFVLHSLLEKYIDISAMNEWRKLGEFINLVVIHINKVRNKKVRYTYVKIILPQ